MRQRLHQQVCGRHFYDHKSLLTSSAAPRLAVQGLVSTPVHSAFTVLSADAHRGSRMQGS